MRYQIMSNNTNTWLTIQLDKGERVDMITWFMLTMNRLVRLLPVVFKEMNGVQTFIYDISGMTRLAEFIEAPVKGRVYSFVEEIAMIVEEADRYLVPRQNLMLDPNYMYIDKSGKIVAMVMPCAVTAGEPDIAACIRAYLANMRFDNSFDKAFAQRAAALLTGKKDFNTRELIAQLERLNLEQEAAKAEAETQTMVLTTDMQPFRVTGDVYEEPARIVEKKHLFSKRSSDRKNDDSMKKEKECARKKIKKQRHEKNRELRFVTELEAYKGGAAL